MAIDHIITNSLFYSNVKTGLTRTDISDYFPIFIVTKMSTNSESSARVNISKRFINENSMLTFKNKLPEMNWEDISVTANTNILNIAYETFLNKFISLYDECFPKKNVVGKTRL